MEDFIVVPSRDDSYVALARTKTGSLYRKHILNFGDLIHPATGQKIKVDEKFVNTLKKNFEDSVCDIVQVPLANDSNQHTEDPTRNIGEVVDIEVKDKKVYAVIDVRDPQAAEKIKNKTILGVSAMMHLNYTDTRTGKKVGPTLLHACATNRPYVVDLEGYEEIVKASAENSESPLVMEEISADKKEEAVLLSEPEVLEKSPDEIKGSAEEPKEINMTKEELLKALKEQHGVDVEALQVKASQGSDAKELVDTLVTALTAAGELKLSNTDSDAAEVIGAVVELAHENAAMSDRVEQLELTNAKAVVAAQVEKGYLQPKQEDLAVRLFLTSPDDYKTLLSDKPLVEMEVESGREDKKHGNEFDVDAEIARLSNPEAIA